MENKEKKMTMQDIADIAGVSIATVSYVLNNKRNSRISEATRKRILHLINLYNYSPSVMAKSLASSSLTNPVGFVIGAERSDNWIFAQEQTDLLSSMARLLRDTQRHILLFEASSTMQYPVEAFIGFNLTKQEIVNLSGQVFVPLVLLDSLTEDTLFFQFCIDHSYIRGEADKLFGPQGYSCVFSPYRNEPLREKLSSDMPREDVCFCEGYSQLKEYARQRRAKGKKLLIFNTVFAVMMKGLMRPDEYGVVTYETMAEQYFRDQIAFAYSSEVAAGQIIDMLQYVSKREKTQLISDHFQTIPVKLREPHGDPRPAYTPGL